MTDTAAPRSAKGVRTRARLLEAAREVFERLGFLDARVSDIVEAAGLSHGSFYHYFDSKEQVFREVAETLEAELTAPAGGEDGDGGDPVAPPATEYERILAANRLSLRLAAHRICRAGGALQGPPRPQGCGTGFRHHTGDVGSGHGDFKALAGENGRGKKIKLNRTRGGRRLPSLFGHEKPPPGQKRAAVFSLR